MTKRKMTAETIAAQGLYNFISDNKDKSGNLVFARVIGNKELLPQGAAWSCDHAVFLRP